jgi:hypothetical protein
MLTNGQFLVAGIGFSNACVRLNPDGSADPGFAFGATSDLVPDVALRRDGLIAAGGFALKLLDPFGTSCHPQSTNAHQGADVRLFARVTGADQTAGQINIPSALTCVRSIAVHEKIDLAQRYYRVRRVAPDPVDPINP